MAVVDAVVALVIALVVGSILALAFGRPGPWVKDLGWGPGLAMLVLLVFLAAWAGGLWIGPVGPAIGGVSWLAPLVIAMIVGMLLAAAPRASRGRRDLQVEERAGVGTAVDSALLVSFGITAVLLVAVVVLGLVT